MNKEEIFKKLNKYNLDKNECIILSGAALVVQDVIESTDDIDIATTKQYYNKINWKRKIGALGKEIKYLDNVEISTNLYNPSETVTINGYKFVNLKYALEVKEMLYRTKDKKIIKDLRKKLHNMSLLNFLGNGNMSNHLLKNTSGYIKFDKTMLLIDSGMTTFYQLLEKGLLNNLDEIFIAITHTHPDHVGSLAALVLYLNFGTNVKINIIINEDFKEQKEHLTKVLNCQGVLNNHFNFLNISDINSFFKMKSEKINHCPELDSYAYEIIIDDETTYYYLGDNNDLNFYINKLKKLKPNDYIFTDISHKKSNVHLKLDDVVNVTPLNLRNQVFLMHFDEIETISISKSLGFAVITT